MSQVTQSLPPSSSSIAQADRRSGPKKDEYSSENYRGVDVGDGGLDGRLMPTGDALQKTGELETGGPTMSHDPGDGAGAQAHDLEIETVTQARSIPVHVEDGKEMDAQETGVGSSHAGEEVSKSNILSADGTVLQPRNLHADGDYQDRGPASTKEEDDVGQHKAAVLAHHQRQMLHKSPRLSHSTEQTAKHKDNVVRTIAISHGSDSYRQGDDQTVPFQPIQGTQLRLRLRNDAAPGASKGREPGAVAAGKPFQRAKPRGMAKMPKQSIYHQHSSQENETQLRRESLHPVDSAPSNAPRDQYRSSSFADVGKSLQGSMLRRPGQAGTDHKVAGGKMVIHEEEVTQTKFQKMMNQTYEILSGLSPARPGGRPDIALGSIGTRNSSRLGPSNPTKTHVMKPLRLDHLIHRDRRAGHSGKPHHVQGAKVLDYSPSPGGVADDSGGTRLFRSNQGDSSGQIFTMYPSTGMTVQDTQRLKEIKNYKFEQSSTWKQDKQRMLDGFKTELQFVQHSQRQGGPGHSGKEVDRGANKGQSASQEHLSAQQIEAIKHQLEGELRDNLNGIALDGSEATTLSQIQNIGEITQRYLENKGLVPNAMQTYTTMSSKGNSGPRASPVPASGATTGPLGPVGDTLNMMSSSLGQQGSIITLDRAKVHEDNQQNAKNIRRFGVARHGEYKKKQVGNLVHSVDLKLQQDSLQDNSTLNMPSQELSKRASPGLPPVPTSPIQVASELGQAREYLDFNGLSKANSSLSNAVNYKDTKFFSSTRNAKHQKSITHGRQVNPLDSINVNYKFIPASIGSAPATQAPQAPGITSFLVKALPRNMQDDYALAASAGDKATNREKVDHVAAKAALSRGPILRTEADNATRASHRDRDTPEVQSKGNKKVHGSVHGAVDCQLNEIQKHLKTVRLQNLADYQKIKEERQTQLSSFRSKYAFRYQTNAAKKGPQMTRTHFEWDNEMLDKYALLAKHEHPKTFQAAKMLRTNRLVLPRVGAQAAEGSIGSPFAVQSPTDGARPEFLSRSLVLDSALRESKETTLGRRDGVQNAKRGSDLVNKKNLNLLSQSCDYDSSIFNELKKKEFMLRKSVNQPAGQPSDRSCIAQDSNDGMLNPMNSDRGFHFSDAGRSQAPFPLKEMSRTFFINGRPVDMPTETQASVESKLYRVSNMAKNLHQIKQSVRDQFLLQQQKQLENYQNYQQDFADGGQVAPSIAQLQSSPRRSTWKGDETKKRSSYALSLDSAVKKPEAPTIGSPDADANPLDGIIRTGRSAETWQTRSGELTPSPRAAERRVISPAMMEEIHELLATLERIEKEKAKAREDWIAVLKEKTRNMAPDYAKLRREIKSKIKAVRDRVIEEVDQHFEAKSHIYSTDAKFKFADTFANSTYLSPLMDKDPEFKEMMRHTHPIIRSLLNQMLESILQKMKHPNDALEGYVKEELLREIKKAVLAERLLKKNTQEEQFAKRSLKHMVVSSVHKAQKREGGARKGRQSTSLYGSFKDAMRREKIERMRTQLQAIFKVAAKANDTTSPNAPGKEEEKATFGKKFDALGQNIFARTDQPQKDKNAAQANNAKRTQLSSFFVDAKHKKIFYDQAKVGKKDPGVCDVNQMMLKYFERVRDSQEVPAPPFAQPLINQNTLYLRETTISDSMSFALKHFLEDTKDEEECWVRSLVIDGCSMSELAFENIIDGAMAQGPRLARLTYSNSTFGEANFQQILKLLPVLADLTLCNLKSTVLNTVGSVALPKPSPESSKFYEALSDSNLLKLKLSKLNFSQEGVVEELCKFISQARTTVYYDLSWNQMKAKELSQVMAAFNAGGQQNIRSLNLSYNTLQFEHVANSFDTKSVELSNVFLEELLAFLKADDMELNHIDLSGMRLQKEQLVPICHALVAMPHLSAVHLNDNGINNFGQASSLEDEDETKLELLDIFGLDASVLQPRLANEKNRELKFHDIVEQRVRDAIAAKYDIENYIDADDKTHAFKDKLTNLKLSRHVGNAKFLNSQAAASGASRLTDDSVDLFTVTRAANHPELVFSAPRNFDSYFEKDAQQRWTLAERGACFVCRKYEYVVVMYQQGEDAVNEGLEEVKDKAFLRGLQQSLNLAGTELLEQREGAPFILGTLVPPAYKKKLKMIRSELFAVLAICQANSFVSQRQHMEGIKHGVLELVRGNQDIEEADGLVDQLAGWNKIVHNIVNQNYLTDVVCVNQPKDLDKKAPSGGRSFIFAGYFPPGHHHFLIFDPRTERAFFKDVVVHLNTYDNFPEYPRMMEKAKRKKPNQNVWRKWIDDSEETEVIVYMNDLTSGLYDPKVVIKNEEDVAGLHDFFKKERKIYKTFFREMIALSSVYPRLKYEDILNHILSKQLDKQDSERLPRSFIELSFLKATDKQNVRGLKGKLCRAEFFNFLIRCVYQFSPKNIHQGLMDFTEKYIMPTYAASEIPKHRKIIRESAALNDLLLKNQDSLTQIFEDFSEKAGFTQQSAIRLIQLCSRPPPGVSREAVKPILPTETVLQCFAFSLMTVRNEQTTSWKYYRLYYVEFLEFLCRAGIKWRQAKAKPMSASRSLTPPTTTLDDDDLPMPETVFEFLRLLYDSRKAQKQEQGRGGGDDEDAVIVVSSSAQAQADELLPLSEASDSEREGP